MTSAEMGRLDEVLSRAIERTENGVAEFRRFTPAEELDLIRAGHMWRAAFMLLHGQMVEAGRLSMELGPCRPTQDTTTQSASTKAGN